MKQIFNYTTYTVLLVPFYYILKLIVLQCKFLVLQRIVLKNNIAHSLLFYQQTVQSTLNRCASNYTARPELHLFTLHVLAT